MSKKLKGCRPSQEVLQEFSNICTNRGAAGHRISMLNKEIETFSKRLEELQLELNESRKQEAEIKAEEEQEEKLPEPTLEVVQ